MSRDIPKKPGSLAARDQALREKNKNHGVPMKKGMSLKQQDLQYLPIIDDLQRQRKELQKDINRLRDMVSDLSKKLADAENEIVKLKDGGATSG